MNNKILVTGGSRSGKSLIAENLALGISKRPVYISTCKVFDSEMALRVSKHKKRRNGQWLEYESYTDLVDIIKLTDQFGTRLIDCLTLWLNNLIYENIDWKPEVLKLVECIEQQKNTIILVTNELGSGILPENKLAREFSDIVGETNSIIAENVNKVYFVVSGISLKIKG